jgi:cell division transport system permease protein
MKDIDDADALIAQFVDREGVYQATNQKEILQQVFDILGGAQRLTLIVALVQGVAALMLVANTIRLAAMARRREIQIMRLVGASTLYITLPFLLEALVAAVVGVGLAALALAGFLKFAIIDGVSREAINFLPWVGWEDYVEVLIGTWPPGIVLIAPALTLVPTLLLARKYTRV